MKLNFKPLEVFRDEYYTDPYDIIKHKTLFRKEYTNFVNYGGRGGGKTVDKIRAVVIESTLRRVRLLITREYLNSIGESSKAEIEAAIDELGLNWFFKITETYIQGLNGSYFLFRGIKNNINNIKSISDVDIVFVEEAENVSKNSWDKLLPSIRPKSGRAIVIVLFNPANELDDTYQRWVVNTPSRTILTRVNWSDNIFFPPFLNDLRLDQKRTLPKKEYDHIWEGMPRGSGSAAIIDLDWIKAARFADIPQIYTVNLTAGFDPAGQGRDYNAVSVTHGNRLIYVEEWAKSPDLRHATQKAVNRLLKYRHLDHDEVTFYYDECGGFGDGVSVFLSDMSLDIEIEPFNAGEAVASPKRYIPETDKTWGEMYANQKAQVHAITAQRLYNTYRYIELGERNIEPCDMLAIDIDDDQLFNKLARELSTPLWIKSGTNSKRKVEAKKDMEKRTGQPSPNLADSLHMQHKLKSEFIIA